MFSVLRFSTLGFRQRDDEVAKIITKIITFLTIYLSFDFPYHPDQLGQFQLDHLLDDEGYHWVRDFQEFRCDGFHFPTDHHLPHQLKEHTRCRIHF